MVRIMYGEEDAGVGEKMYGEEDAWGGGGCWCSGEDVWGGGCMGRRMLVLERIMGRRMYMPCMGRRMLVLGRR